MSRSAPDADVPDPGADPAVRAALAELGCGSADQLHIGGLPARELLERFGSPLYAYDADVLRRRVAAVRAALGPRVDLLYSIKANPGVAVTAALRAAGTGAEIASLGELEVALAAGHDPAALRFAGPAKTDAELDAALRRGLGCVHVEAPDEVAALATVAGRSGLRAGVAVRVNLAQEAQGARMRMGGSGARFGVDEGAVPAVLRAIAAAPALELRGLHVYAGTQCFDAAAFAAAARALCERAAGWERDLGVRLDELDLGGGFGVATYLGDPGFDLDAAGRAVQALVAAHDRPGRRWFVELGRYLVAASGVYLTRVVHRKTGGDRVHLAIDGGLHHCAIAAGSGSVLRRPPLMVAADRLRTAATEVVAV
ncbi:MAG: alanine racemase, partial [Planctomycetota bacterium]